jgi:hypothetical protein
MLSPGRPPSLLVQFLAKRTIGQCVNISGEKLYVTIAQVEGLETGSLVLAVLQIPPGMYIQAKATVERIAGRRLKLTLTDISPQQIRQIRQAAGL